MRSGIGRLTLIDLDHIAESNINRQLQATEPDLGRAKVLALSERMNLINPGCELELIEAFVDDTNIDHTISPGHAWVIDCIDNFRVKAAMIHRCRQRRQQVITVGGAGGQVDPTRVRVTDLRQTEQDPLLARTRRLLRQDFGFPRNPKRRFGVPCVWSDEPQRRPIACDAGGEGSNEQIPEGSLNCAGFGACMPVTATFGLVAAGHVIERIACAASVKPLAL